MSTNQSDVSTILLDKVADWLTQSSLAGDNLETIIRGFCERIAAAGLPLVRVHLTFSMLHPLYDALGFTWHRASGMTVEGYRHGNEKKPERFLLSPYFYLLSNNLEHVRRRIDADGPVEFPIFEELKELGVTDYLAFVQPFGGESTQGMMGSWSTDNKHGFSEGMVAALLRLQNQLAVAAKMAVLGKLADNMLTTYLGGNAGKRVLNGQIRRGDGETIRAALVMGDMRQSTMLAEKEGRQAYIDTLNHFFDAIAAPFNRGGGEILSFMGDGFLAVYPCGRHKDPSQIACQAALSAVFKAQARVAELNKERRKEGLSDIRYGVGLHVGNVMFGNVGLKDRLTFSAFGSAVNEVQRLQNLTKKYSREVVASQAFASYCGGDWVTLGEEKLRGVGQKVTVLLPKQATREIAIEEALDEVAYDGLSEAEQVMLLHRDAKTQVQRPLLEKFMQ
ncbi:adenylate/guanylate cyclase domain-containing protein [Phyllobacterium sp. 21LDTY02-6]|jgi:adenylate cyclase|uniref:adenylate/guanylate cyclase domain-containing protein n=1 Tax=unclassified Phyllobacterium TaxID=2638441 RepID=UPI0020206ECC|nr:MULTISPECIES: adenylate/guanylate cyclase domain-containing protein [unclassified Phyllobacterium]MCO4315633.1 adenylate/guanylate cyclase domain-containing protein [Phyllobacterium sp. 21LDTY02-6]MCX8280955.1 adenylate/guanylate cyclase domain-containing protein [Phyllobacterium sp. 0TCS1.6C]MCX8295821.1 adenylate/guanylate cyclase domain-containing protein [Phyllobacterium sp. 0TCS1.6A]